ncbi:uncharacterized protein LOC126991177 [Eriocheir sinensis]|uniref:uncharacterized protein LOC126991177 n=1 Tax=Eriocheir sinensis TaxID=95602 RepID=UPI0021C5DF25|nr:uncharacterized protein LOC126991177 [Eriocheir sinensis]
MSPAGHTTTTTESPPENTAGGGEREIFFNHSYLRTYEGILKLAQLVIAVQVFVSVMVSEHPRGGTSDWISFSSMGSFWFSDMLFVMYLVNAVVVLTDVPCGMPRGCRLHRRRLPHLPGHHRLRPHRLPAVHEAEGGSAILCPAAPRTHRHLKCEVLAALRFFASGSF